MIKHSLLVRTIAQAVVLWQRNKQPIEQILIDITLFLGCEIIAIAFSLLVSSLESNMLGTIPSLNISSIIIGHILIYSAILVAHMLASIKGQRFMKQIRHYITTRTRRCRINIKDAILQDKLKAK